MKKNLTWIGAVALLGLVGLAVFPPGAAAARYDSLVVLLIDLDGWQAEEAEGMDMDMGGMKMVQAMRTYNQGGKSLNAMVMVGNAMMAQGQQAAMQSGSMETKEVKVKTGTIDGFPVMQQYNKTAGEGAVIVTLGGADEKAAMFILNFTGLQPDDALSLSKKFDWKKMQEITGKVK